MTLVLKSPIDTAICECIMSTEGVQNEHNDGRINSHADLAILQGPCPVPDLTQIRPVVVDLNGFEDSIRDASSS